MKLQKTVLLVLSLVLSHSAFAHSKAFTPAFVDTLIEPYLLIQAGFAGDDFAASVAAADQLANALDAAPVGADAQAIVTLLRASTTRIRSAKDLKAARNEFPALSSELRLLVEYVGTSGKTSLFRVNCPMVSGGKGGPANWLQADETIMNPYYGATMLHCGVIDKQVVE
ncbi:MAG: DUF3347 domain-containing protein [Opitutaceae bacterium]